MRLLSLVLLVAVAASGVLSADEDNSTQTVSEPEVGFQASPVDLEAGPTNTTAAAESAQPIGASQAYPRGARTARRRGRKWRGYYNDFRYRNPANNPYNPSSPYAFRGRPGQTPVQQPVQQQVQPGYYSDPRYAQYYDPYNQQQQYYGYQQGYPPPQQQGQYYQYPYPPQPQPQPQLPPSPPPTEEVPELYYVEKPSSPDGHYQYKKVSVVQDFSDRSRRRRPTRWPQYQQGYQQPPQGYYNYPYNPYDRRPPPPSYYQPYQYPQQYQYSYPRARARPRTGRPPLRSTVLPGSWRLTYAPVGVFDATQLPEEPVPTAPQPTEASGD